MYHLRDRPAALSHLLSAITRQHRDHYRGNELFNSARGRRGRAPRRRLAELFGIPRGSVLAAVELATPERSLRETADFKVTTR